MMTVLLVSLSGTESLTEYWTIFEDVAAAQHALDVAIGWYAVRYDH